MKLLIPFLIAILFSLTACKDWGTEGGNPEVVHSPTTGVGYFANTICHKREACSGQKDLQCENEFALNPQVTAELRMDGTFATFQELIDSLDRVNLSFPKMNECLEEIQSMDCNSTLAQDAFDPATYEDIHLALRASTSCGEIFTNKN